MGSFLAKLKNPLVLGYVVVVLLLLAGAVYVTMIYINGSKTDDNKSATTKPKLVAPAAVQKDLATVNKTAEASYNLHNSAQQSLEEQQVRLSR